MSSDPASPPGIVSIASLVGVDLAKRKIVLEVARKHNVLPSELLNGYMERLAAAIQELNQRLIKESGPCVVTTVKALKIDEETAILEATAQVFGVTVSNIKSQKRSTRFSQPRQVAMHLLRGAGCTLKHTAWVVSRRDHTTVVHGLKAVQKRMESNPQFLEKVQSIKKLLGM